jgi:hypothetical protein
LLIVLLASPVSAQYFGRNKVRYRAHDFQIMATEHFDIYFYPSERAGVEIAARLAERWHARLTQFFGHALSGRQPLVLYASHSDFSQTNVITGELSEGTGGVTEPLRRRIVLPLAGPIGETDHVIGHELVHAFQFDIAMPAGAQTGLTAFARLPLWFVEGMAEYLSLGGVDAHAAMKVRDAVSRNDLPSILDLRKPKYFPYQWGHAVFAYIAGRYGDHAVSRLFRSAVVFGSVESAIETSLGITARELSTAWHSALRQLYEPVLSASVPLPATGRLALAAARPTATLNFAPSLSPDGRWIAFFSTRGYSSPDLYVADADSGRVVRRLTRTATDPRYSSIQYINSSATWDPASGRIAIAAIIGGRAALAVFEAVTGRWDRDIVMSGIDEIRSPAWAPDGRAIAFTGMRQGIIDLYVYDVQTGAVRQLTSDAYADLHPAWSPDSRHVAFATDRFSSELDSLRPGALQLAIADVETGAPALVAAFGRGKHINPQWSPDGQSLLFVAEPDGIPNVYRLSLPSRTIEQMTATGIGVSGITPSGPALSVSSRSGRLAVSAYDSDRYDIHIWSAPAPEGPSGTWTGDAAALSPADRPAAIMPGVVEGADPSLPTAHPYPTTPYEATMSRVGQTQSGAGVGFGGAGAGAAGGVGFAFSDMLNDRLLVTAAQVDSPVAEAFSVNDVAFEIGYLRQDRRWTWAVVAGQMPYLTGVFESGRATAPDGGEQEIYRQTLLRETRRSSSLIVWYPFDRARRLELAAGVVHATREQIVGSTIYSAETGELLSGSLETREIGQGLELASSAAALVSDTASFGPVSPIHGQRSRLEVAPTFGTLRFTSVLVDYRRYVMPVAFYTIAARVIHYGRYGTGAEDARLQPLFLNDPGLVRGYPPPDYASTACVAMPADACHARERLVGSRILVGNVEVRLPLLRPFGVGPGMYGPLPVELALFGDSGVAWRGGDTSIPDESRTGIASVGVAFRVGLGFAVAEFDLVRPLQASEDRWTFGFNLIPGW